MTGRRPYAGPERRSRRIPLRFASLAALTAGGIVYATLCPVGLRPHLGNADEERFMAYLVLGFAVALTFRRRWAQVSIGLVLLAVGLEVAQAFAPGRHAQVADAALKSLGALFGSGAGYSVFPARRAWLRLLQRPAGRLPPGLARTTPPRVSFERPPEEG